MRYEVEQLLQRRRIAAWRQRRGEHDAAMQQNVAELLRRELALAAVLFAAHALHLAPQDALGACETLLLLQGEQRERALRALQPQLRPLVWETVLCSLSPDALNNLPHRFYAQFLGFELRGRAFRPAFRNLIAATVVETLPFRGFAK